jgi:hypothetical protein
MASGGGAVRNVCLIIVGSIVAVALAFDPAGAQTVPIDNIEIRMVKTSTRPPLRITAETRNPNDFAVRDIEVDCTIKDKAGNDLATYTSIVYGMFQPNQRITTKNLNIGAWPEQGYAALCVSRRGVRMTSAVAPGPAPQPAPAPAPSTGAASPSGRSQ